MNKETLNKLKELADHFIPEARDIVLMAHKELSERTTSPVSQMTDEQKAEIVSKAEDAADAWADGREQESTSVEVRARVFDAILAATAPHAQAPAAPVAEPAEKPWHQVATVTMDGHQLREALNFLNPDGDAEPDQLDEELTFGVVQHKDDDGTVSTGLCCWNDDTDGVYPLTGDGAYAPKAADPAAQPQPVAEQGELPKPKQGGHMDFAHEWSLQMQDGFSKHWMHPVNHSAHQLEVFKAQHEGYQAGWRDCARAAIAASQPAAEPVARWLTDAEVRQVFLRNGFTIKEGQADLKQYVYEAAHALMDAMMDAAPAIQQPQDERASIEEAAKAIYPLLLGDAQGSPADFPWRDGGNSYMQDLARRMARAALTKTGDPANCQNNEGEKA